mmetsp:Transcript_66224/g.110617  ORF Transcript_66224/g.110617 Transcript_66224/m.110617 type:complete len:244 (-) Transcript_66224:82-813(-)
MWIVTQRLHTDWRMDSLSKTTLSKKRFATDFRASFGHKLYQSMVMQLTRDGNMRSRVRKLSPMGDITRTVCMFSRHKYTKCARMVSRVSGLPKAFTFNDTEDMMRSMSSFCIRLGTSPVFKILLTSSRKVSCAICVSFSMNTSGLSRQPASSSTFLRSSRNSTIPYPRVTAIMYSFMSAMKAARRVKLCRPLPPTPTRSTLPRGWRSTRQMRERCSTASSKNTKSSSLLKLTLYAIMASTRAS